MANHVSSEKRARQTVVRTARNIAILSRVRSAVRSFRQTLAGSDNAAMDQALATALREIQKAGSKGTLHYRTVSRRVSRLVQARNTKQSAAASA